MVIKAESVPRCEIIDRKYKARVWYDFILNIGYIGCRATRYADTPAQWSTLLFVRLSRLGVKATTLKAKAKAKDLAFKAKAKAKDDVKANVNMVRCSVKTSKHRRLLQGW